MIQRPPEGAPAPGDRVVGWSEHLRSGGTTSWREWCAEKPSAVPMGPAAPLEVVRRLNARLARARPALADLVLETPVGGRGPVDAPLAGAGSAFGPTPVEPGEVPDRELVRVCVAVLARAYGGQEAPPARRAPRRRWRGPAFQIMGASPQADAVRRALLAAGHSQRAEARGRRARVLIVGGPLDVMLAAHWRVRVERGAGLRWRRVWATAAANDRLPAGADLVALADRAVGQVGLDRVHLVLDEEPGAAVTTAARLLGVPLRPLSAAGDPAETDLLRRLNQALATIRPDGLGQAWLAADFARPWTLASSLGAPRPWLGWAVDAGARLADGLARRGLLVHGDVRLVVPSDAAGAHAVPAGRTLEVALDVLATSKVVRAAEGRG